MYRGISRRDFLKATGGLAAGGTMGDVIWISSIEGYFLLAATGVLAPIDDIVESLGYDLEEHYPATISAAYLDGQLYGIPILAHPGRCRCSRWTMSPAAVGSSNFRRVDR